MRRVDTAGFTGPKQLYRPFPELPFARGSKGGLYFRAGDTVRNAVTGEVFTVTEETTESYAESKRGFGGNTTPRKAPRR